MNKAAQQLGRLGGKAKSPAKTAANKRNADKRWEDYRRNKAAKGKA